MVQETLAKFLPGRELPFLQIKESPLSFRYRNRIQPKYLHGRFGFFARRSHEIIEANDCPITEEKLTAEFGKIKLELDKRFLNSKETQRLELFLDQDENPQWFLMGDGRDGVGFSQVNRFQNDDLIKTVLEWSGDLDYERIFDLYSGSGNFSFPLSEKFHTQQVVGAELDPILVQKAHTKTLASEASNTRIQFHQSDVSAFLKRTQLRSKDLVILDPPRAGADKFVMTTLAQGSVLKIIYISCQPTALARDLAYFFTAQKQIPHPRRLRLKKVQCFEMFPQTDHVETIAELAVDTL